MKKIIFFIILLFITSNVYALDAKLERCIDGDTASFIVDSKSIKVRFLAIDTPESTNKIEKWGKEASMFTCDKLTTAKEIILELDTNSSEYDKYDRLLAWVFVDNKLLQEDIIINGYGEVAYLYGDYKYTNLLLEAELTAKDNKIGIWSNEEDPNFIYLLIAILIVIYPVLKKYIRKIKKYQKTLSMNA